MVNGFQAIYDKPVEVFVNYSYQGLENYEDWMEGIKTPEDYFDTFSSIFSVGREIRITALSVLWVRLISIIKK